MSITTKEMGINRNLDLKCEECNQLIKVGSRFYHSYNKDTNLPVGIDKDTVMCEECYKKEQNNN